MISKKNIVVLAPHTDDGELGCGGTIARLIEEGANITYIAFSTASKSIPEGYPSNQLAIEVKEATEKLGVQRLIIFDYEVRKLNYSRQEILEDLIKLRPELNPDIVFLPSQKDIHQDHSTITNEGIRAFKNVSILGYELIWNNLSFESDCFIKLEERHINKKIEVLQSYKTQKGRNYMSPDFIRSLAVIRGTQVNTDYAESFEVIRWIL